MTTIEEACTLAKRLGGVEYQTVLSSARCFEFPQLVGTPNCDLNDRPPSLHVEIYSDHGEHHGGVQAKMYGTASGRALSANIYSIRRDELEAMFPTLLKVAAAVWVAFAEGMKP